MAEITTQRTAILLRKLVEILLSSPELRAKDALASLRERVQLTEFELGEYPSGGQRFEKIVRFATIALVKAGWLLKEKGRWSVTEEGKHAYNEFKTPEEFYKVAVEVYNKWKRNRPEDEGEVEKEVGEKHAAITFEEAEEQAWGEIEEYLGKMPPYEFQNLIASLLKGMGYHVSWIAPTGKDRGIDILAWNDPLGTKPPRIKVQVKREQKATTVEALRSFMAVLGDGDVGIFVSIGGFTKDAEDEARTQQSRQVTLINLEGLYELWIEHIEKLDEEARNLFPLKPIYFIAPET